jgi:hypothetical protein
MQLNIIALLLMTGLSPMVLYLMPTGYKPDFCSLDMAASQGVVTSTIQKDDYIGNMPSTVVETVTLNPVPLPAFTGLSVQACGSGLSTYTLTASYPLHSWI